MKHIQISLILILTMIAFSCGRNKEKVLATYFSETEIHEIKKIIDFVVEEIVYECNGTSQFCYDEYFKKLANLSPYEDVDIKIDKVKQKKILNEISDDLKWDIWSFCQGVEYVKNKNQTLCANTNGRIGQIIVDLQKDNKKFKSYAETFHYIGGFTPSLNAGMLRGYYKFNFDSEVEMFVLAVHLLTMNGEKWS
jgi:hypothetical protein